MLLVLEAVIKDHSFLHRVFQLADKDPAQRMVSATTPDLSITEKDLRLLFGRHGEIEFLSISPIPIMIVLKSTSSTKNRLGWRSKIPAA